MLFIGRYDSANLAEQTKVRHEDGLDAFVRDRAAEAADLGIERRNGMMGASGDVQEGVGGHEGAIQWAIEVFELVEALSGLNVNDGGAAALRCSCQE